MYLVVTREEKSKKKKVSAPICPAALIEKFSLTLNVNNVHKLQKERWCKSFSAAASYAPHLVYTTYCASMHERGPVEKERWDLKEKTDEGEKNILLSNWTSNNRSHFV